MFVVTLRAQFITLTLFNSLIMMPSLTIKNSILIDAPAAIVWDALTNPAQTIKYMFGCKTVSDWKKGSPLLWQGTHEGKDMVFVKGTIVDMDPGKLLSYTTIDPNSEIADVPQNYLTVTYILTQENGKTLLTVIQGDYSIIEDGERRYKEASNNGEGWNPILLEIKKLVECK